MTKLAVLALSEIAVLTGDVAAKNWATRGGWGWFTLAAVAYLGVNASWLAILKLCGGDLARATAYWLTSGGVATALLGLLYYREQMSWVGIVGLLFIVAGAIMVAR